MKSISRMPCAGLGPLIPAVLAPPEVLAEAPQGFIPPPLNPTGARLETKELAPGVYALLSSKPPVDNSGFVVGEHGVLVVDAHINRAMAELIQAAPDFAPWIHGESGKFKSELAALSQGHFGPFTRQSLPLNFSSTPNALERILFILKDVLVVVDDYHPPADQREANAMSQVASRLTRSAGNASGRGRLRSDLTPRSDFYPRSIAMVTGERLPDGYSTLARIFPIEVKAGDIRPDLLTEAQNARDLFPKAMSAFLQWLALHGDNIRATLTKRFLELRTQARDVGRHGREPGQVAHLYCALELWMTFCVEIGAIEADERDAWLKCAWNALREQAVLAAREMQQETPTKRFLALLVDGFASRQIYMEDRAGKAPHNPDMWGWEWKSDALGARTAISQAPGSWASSTTTGCTSFQRLRIRTP